MPATTIHAHAVDPADLETLAHATERLPKNSEAAKAMGELLSVLGRGDDVILGHRDVEYTPNQAAEILSMSRTHLRKFIENGALKSYQKGAHHRIAQADLRDFMRRREAAKKVVAEALSAGPTDHGSLTDEALKDLDAL